MVDSEDEFRQRDPPGRRRGAAARGAGTVAAPAAGPSPVPPECGLKRGGAPRPAGRKRRREAGGEPLAVPARSRLEAGPGGKRPRAEARGRGRPPPPLLLQGPEEARRGLEARAALLLSEAPAAPRTPPLPASRWKGAPANASPGGWLWELSSLTGAPAVAPWGADQRPEFGTAGAPAEPPETERFPSRTGECFKAGSPRDADTLQDLLELAGEGLTFTQWSLDVGRLEHPEQEQMPGVQQKAFTRLLEKQQQQQQQLSQKCSCETFPLGSLAAAFKEMVNNPHLSDIQIQVDSGEVFYAHMFVLYARCPQLLQFVDHRRFVVAEEGEVGASRVLLYDAPGDAVALFLKYLYTAEYFIPQHLLSDVIDLAIRFGVKELAALCEGQPSEEISVEKPADDKDKVGDFEELLKSMWQDEDEETVAKAVCRDEISDSMNEQELEEIYEFVATQRRMTSDEARKEKVCTEYRCDEVEKKIGQDGGSCPRKVLEKPRRGVTIKKSEIKCDHESSKLRTSIASMGKDLKKYSVEFQQNLKEIVSFRASSRKEPTSEIHLGLAGDSTHSNHLETSATQFSVSEMKCCSVWKQNINIAKDKTTARNFSRLFQAPAKDLQMSLPRDLEVPFSPITSGSQPNILDRLPSQNEKQQNTNRKGEAPIGSLEKSGAVNPQDLNITSNHIVVLDSDEELEREAEKKLAEAASSFSEQQSWHKESPVADVLNCWSPAPPQQDVSKVGDGLGTLICNEAQSLGECHQPLDPSGHKEGSFWEGLGWSEGRTLVVPETPLAAWNSLNDVQVEKSRLNSSLEKQWTHEAQTEPLSCSYELLPVLSSTSLLEIEKPDNGLCAAERDVVVVDDSEEEQEAVPLCSRGIFVEPLEAITANARNPLRTSVHMFDMQNNHPVTVASSVTNSAATFHFGVGDLLLHNSQNWPGEDFDSNVALPASSSLSASIPVPKISDLALQARDISCVTPLMPFPPYSSMDTPELKKELSRFGVRALPKRQMVLKLKEIFQFTHQQAGTDSKKKSMPVFTSSFQKLQQKCLSPYRLLQGSPNTTNHTDLSEGGAQKPEAGLGWPKGAALPTNRATDGEGNGDLILTTSEVPAGTRRAGSETYAASQSSSVEFKVSMLAEKEGNVPASSIAASGEGQKLEILKHYIHSNPSLCQQILLYQPIELSVLHAELKQNGVRIALDKLLDFLDANCITFTNAEARREKKHLHRCKKKGQR
ncbi:structure-specific endonuclease subunit SLX4 isoform X1 [Pantherophis guttatus]|uniref:Structure-specific endonuclease subunit SLX4 n=1 Tax=Pantherophis guttatus TaxID=94885 RepID=A0A6P9DP22_PANGU|nr:structure-specific endonuclease subunit SLX4 isoform X1 [Pantherophis guttatus]